MTKLGNYRTSRYLFLTVYSVLLLFQVKKGRGGRRSYLILVVEGGVEDLVLYQLIVAITGGAPRPPALPAAARLAHQQLPLTATRPCTAPTLGVPFTEREVASSVADPDPGYGAFLTPGSEIRDG